MGDKFRGGPGKFKKGNNDFKKGNNNNNQIRKGNMWKGSNGGRGGGGGGGRGGGGGGGRGGGGRGGGGRGGGGNKDKGFKKGKVIVVPHRFPGVYLLKGKSDILVTRNLVPGESVYGEKRYEVMTDDEKIEYRVWNPFRSKLGACLMGGVGNMPIKPGSKVLYLGAANANCVDSTAKPEVVFASEMEKLKKESCKPKEKLTLEPYHRNHAIVLGMYR
ncbi:rRNA 2'-O-methyltransferase fibrillarin, putative [Plasmodium vinckei]|uniref:rRNA 2'-O-methyltransferase fibrillarin n=1 Tax=Plasmodium vinckei TaxID=5860 RepID=A0A6V7T562_PLAVN|nr:rRNA 2'-O-methyltransferase fibrillarin, putative [Plasmodium vinckei]